MFAASAIWIYGLVALGAVGVYLLLPKVGKPGGVAGAVLGLAAIAGLVALGAGQIGRATGLDFYFLLFAAVAVIGSVCVITQRSAVYSALFFLMVVLAVAAMLLRLEAEFLAMALLIVYGGAILVTYVFVIMLASQSGRPLYDRRARAPLGACFAGFLMTALVCGTAIENSSPVARPNPALSAAEGHDGSGPVAEGNTLAIGAVVLTRYVAVVELAGVLLLLAMVGAIAIATKHYPVDTTAATEHVSRAGQAGREAAPF